MTIPIEIEEKRVFVTGDGNEFETREVAEKHNRFLQLANLLEYCDGVMDSIKTASFLIENSDTVVEVLRRPLTNDSNAP